MLAWRADGLILASTTLPSAPADQCHAAGIPSDLSLVGFDDTGPARWPSFSLTSVSQPLRPRVDAALALICAMIETPVFPLRQEVVRGSARIPTEGCVTIADRLVWRPPADEPA